MKESDLRKWHGWLGLTLALFILLQAGSGLLMSFGALGTPHSHAQGEPVMTEHHNDHGESSWNRSLGFIHHGAGTIGGLYRVLLGIGMLGMVVTGCMIFFKTRARTKRANR